MQLCIGHQFKHSTGKFGKKQASFSIELSGMLKKYFSKITLFTILAFFCLTALFIVAISHQSAIIKEPWLYHLSIAVVLFITIDILLKLVLKLKPVWLWLIQIFLMLLAVYIWIIS